MDSTIFNDLFVLEMANNHWGSVERGLAIIRSFAEIIAKNPVKTAIKLQFRDVDNFIHKDFTSLTTYRYITKTLATKLSDEEYALLVEEVRKQGLITMSTPFDERSVDLCVALNVDIIKIASSDINDWILIKKIATAQKPVIVSTGGASLEDITAVVNFFADNAIPLAINHCVSLYPTAKEDMDLAQIEFLRKLFPNNVIGFSTHECNEDIQDAMLIAYAKGARTFERHIDIENREHGVSSYCSLPEHIDTWITAYKKAKAMSGEQVESRREIPVEEVQYLDALVRGAYAKRSIKKGEIITIDDVYFAIPLQKGQISCREYAHKEVATSDIQQDAPITIHNSTADYMNDSLHAVLCNRGL